MTDFQAIIGILALYTVAIWLEARATRNLTSDDRTDLSANERTQQKLGQFPLLIAVSVWASVESSILRWQTASIAGLLAFAAYLSPLAWATTRRLARNAHRPVRIGMYLLGKLLQVTLMGVMLWVLLRGNHQVR